MKTTIDIADDIFRRGKELAKRQNLSFKDLVEEGLSLAMEKHTHKKSFRWRPVTVKGKLTPEFSGAGWEKFQDAIYKGRGA